MLLRESVFIYQIVGYTKSLEYNVWKSFALRETGEPYIGGRELNFEALYQDCFK